MLYLETLTELKELLSHDVASESDISTCIKIDKPLASSIKIYITLITASRIFGKILTFSHQNRNYKMILIESKIRAPVFIESCIIKETKSATMNIFRKKKYFFFKSFVKAALS